MPENPSAISIIGGALALGFSLSEAVQRALGKSLTEFAAAHGHRQSEVSMCLGGYPGRVYPEIREDLAADLGTSREHVDRMIEAGRRPRETNGDVEEPAA